MNKMFLPIERSKFFPKFIRFMKENGLNYISLKRMPYIFVIDKFGDFKVKYIDNKNIDIDAIMLDPNSYMNYIMNLRYLAEPFDNSKYILSVKNKTFYFFISEDKLTDTIIFLGTFFRVRYVSFKKGLFLIKLNSGLRVYVKLHYN